MYLYGPHFNCFNLCSVFCVLCSAFTCGAMIFKIFKNPADPQEAARGLIILHVHFHVRSNQHQQIPHVVLLSESAPRAFPCASRSDIALYSTSSNKVHFNSQKSEYEG